MSQPNVIKIYSEGMRGVDIMDRLLESYGPGTIMKNWCFFVSATFTGVETLVSSDSVNVESTFYYGMRVLDGRTYRK